MLWIVLIAVKFDRPTLTYKVLPLNQPLYLTHLLLVPYTRVAVTGLRKHLLLEPAASTVIGSRGFSYNAAPSIWNKLPLKIRSSSSFVSFKRNLIFPCLRPVSSSFPLATARVSYSALRLNTRALGL